MSGEKRMDLRPAYRQTRDEKMSDLHAANGTGSKSRVSICANRNWKSQDFRSRQDLQTGEDRRRVFYESSVSGFGHLVGAASTSSPSDES